MGICMVICMECCMDICMAICFECCIEMCLVICMECCMDISMAIFIECCETSQKWWSVARSPARPPVPAPGLVWIRKHSWDRGEGNAEDRRTAWGEQCMCTARIHMALSFCFFPTELSETAFSCVHVDRDCYWRWPLASSSLTTYVLKEVPIVISVAVVFGARGNVEGGVDP